MSVATQENDVQKRSAELGRGRVATAAGVIGAIVASSCCILPLALVTLGVGGAWMGNLTALEPYRPYTISATAVILGIGFWQVYLKPRKACAEGSYCASPTSGRITKTALWAATVLVLGAATVDYWAPFFY
ncbi:MAG: mercury transporter MerT [Thiobacillus sp.]|nr:mercury transporter MerT [Thiobacillus sp.]